jgi:nicotinamidase-related amidase
MRAEIQISADRLAALFIDLQEEHRQDTRFLVEDYGKILENAAQLLDAARSRGVLVAHAAYIIDPSSPAPFNPVSEDGVPVFSARGDPLTEICSEVAPLPEEILVVKAQPSVFGSTGLADRLKSRGIEWLLIAGVWTEACIEASVKDAIRAGFRVLLVKDACGSGTDAMHRTGVLNIANRLYRGAIVDTPTACALLNGETGDVWMVEAAVPLRYTFENAAELYDAL